MLIYLQANEARVLIPSLSVVDVIGDSCVTSNTPGKIAPFVDTLDMVKNIDIFYLDINPNGDQS